ncbi:ABC transporter ATP-binding protein [Spirochaeta lutea]|uniref:ABC transporter ATP-binding protein n=1 Tax=Spirochaeta lutea TaxID=1480694 RepID=UPI00068A3845|nr:ABC transporter ATP-binding protein [Spirochaeta lutea]
MRGTPAVSCANLEVSLPEGGAAVRGVSLSLYPGEILGILGESGAGKSLLARTLYGLNRVLPQLRVSGQIDRPRGHAMIFQDPGQFLNPGQSIRGHFNEILRVRGIPKHQWRDRIADLLGFVNLPSDQGFLSSRPSPLSGGQQQRVMIALAMAQEPEVIYADEPVTALDGVSRDLVLGLLQRLAQERQVGILFISHDLKAIDAIAHRVAVMYAGTVVEVQAAEDFFTNPLHPYSRDLLQAQPRMDRRGRTLTEIPGAMPEPHDQITGCPFAPRCKQRFEPCTKLVPWLQHPGHSSGVGTGAEVACHLFDPRIAR